MRLPKLLQNIIVAPVPQVCSCNILVQTKFIYHSFTPVLDNSIHKQPELSIQSLFSHSYHRIFQKVYIKLTILKYLGLSFFLLVTNIAFKEERF